MSTEVKTLLYIVTIVAVLACAAAQTGAAPKDKGSWTIQTADTQLTIGLLDGKPIIANLSAPSSGEQWPYIRLLTSVPEAVLPTTAEIDGKALKVDWAFEGVTSDRSKIAVVYRCAAPDLELVSIWESASLPGPIEHRVIITNRGREIVTFVPPATINIPLAFPAGRAVEVWWVEKGGGRPPSQHGTHTEQVGDGYSKSLLCGPYSQDNNRDAIPWFSLQDTTGKHGIYGGVEFSGWNRTTIERKGDKLTVSMGLDPRDGKTRMRLKPGESLQLPTCFVGVYTGEVDDGCNRLHRWVEKHLRPPMPGEVTPLLVNNSWGSGMQVDEPLAKRMIDDCAEMGIEVFHVDAGWFKHVGDWHTDPTKFPEGLEATADYAHSKGLKFGLWTGWTQGGDLKNAPTYAISVFSPDQKSWFGHDFPEDWKNGPFSGGTVCLGCADARKWCLAELRRWVKDFKLDLLSHDQNMILDGCGRTTHEHLPNDPVDVSRASADGYYEVYDTLRKENPKLIFEDCVNGGRLVDFGVVKRNHYVCATDAYDPLSLRRSFYDASFPLPPSMVEAYIANHPGTTLASFKFMLRSSMMGWCTVMIDTSKWTPEQRNAAKAEFATYKKKLRPFIANGNLYHVLPRPDNKVWDGVQYVDPKTGNAVLYVFRPRTDEATKSIVLRGLNSAKRYKVEATDASCSGVYTGAELVAKGLEVSLPEQDSSDIVFLNVVR